MHLLYYLALALFIALMVNDRILARKVRRAAELGQLGGDAFQKFSAGGSPLGVVVNLLRLASIPSSNAFFGPAHVSVHRQLRLQQVLAALFLGCIAAAIIRGVAT